MAGSQATLSIVFFAVWLAAALAAVRVPGVPWEALVVVLPLGALALWHFVAGRPTVALGTRRVGS